MANPTLANVQKHRYATVMTSIHEKSNEIVDHEVEGFESEAQNQNFLAQMAEASRSDVEKNGDDVLHLLVAFNDTGEFLVESIQAFGGTEEFRTKTVDEVTKNPESIVVQVKAATSRKKAAGAVPAKKAEVKGGRAASAAASVVKKDEKAPTPSKRVRGRRAPKAEAPAEETPKVNSAALRERLKGRPQTEPDTSATEEAIA